MSADDCGGIPADRVPLLFAPGQSGTGSTGLGLYLARGLIERNGGTISWQPSQEGSSFVVQLPVAFESEQ